MDHLLQQLENDHRRLLRLMYLLNREFDKFSGLQNGRHNCDQVLEILTYIQTYPEIWHHPVEDIIFSHLLDKPTINHIAVEALLRDHPRLEALSKQMAGIYDELQTSGAAPSPQILRLSRHYYAEQMSHITAERSIFAVVDAVFDDNDWCQIKNRVRRQLSPRNQQSMQDEYINRCEPVTKSHVLTFTGLH